MSDALLHDIEKFLAQSGLGAKRFGWLAAKNGRLVDRLRAGDDITTRTEARVRLWMRDNADRVSLRPRRAKAAPAPEVVEAA